MAVAILHGIYEYITVDVNGNGTHSEGFRVRVSMESRYVLRSDSRVFRNDHTPAIILRNLARLLNTSWTCWSRASSEIFSWPVSGLFSASTCFLVFLVGCGRTTTGFLE